MAAKLKDGLFIGDADSSQDIEFLELNKIGALVNLAAKEIPCVWAEHGLIYLSYEWEDRENFELFDPKLEILHEIANFIDKSIRHGTSVLIFSCCGVGRCAACICAYLMFKYGWGFEKAYDFVFSKKADIELNRGFVEQLFLLDKRLRMQRHQDRSLSVQERMRLESWDPAYLKEELEKEEDDYVSFVSSKSKNKIFNGMSFSHLIPECVAMDELLMLNSFLNGKVTV